jgi:hypothetical protein
LGQKKIETRLGRLFTHRGDLVICNNQHSSGKKLATCIVEVFGGRYMIPEDVRQAMIAYDQKRGCLFLRNWRWLDEPFEYSKWFVGGTYQGIFSVEIPGEVKIIPQPQITAAVDFMGVII